MIKLFKLTRGTCIEIAGQVKFLGQLDWDKLFQKDDLLDFLYENAQKIPPTPKAQFLEWTRTELLAPMGSQEIWASGVTYYRSRNARMEESADAGGADFYDKVYEADRPELFFKASAKRTVGSGGVVRIRKDSGWDVPEPELTLVLSSSGKILGYTVGNDMSSRSIEGENPLYLPQAKVYEGCAGLGPCILLMDEPLDPQTSIQLELFRYGQNVFTESTQINQIKRKLPELVDWLFRECDFPEGCFLMTGTGIVPEDFSLQTGDEIRITIPPIGTLINWVGPKKDTYIPRNQYPQKKTTEPSTPTPLTTMITLTGNNLLGFQESDPSPNTFSAISATQNTALPVNFSEADSATVALAVHLANKAFPIFSKMPGTARADFLDNIAEEIEALGDTLIQRCMAESGLPQGRLEGERGRTCNQLRLFASVLREGSWVGARIDHAQPDRKPIPKPDIRQMQIALGPVAVFGASNFPLAFSVAGGDTASALAAGCPVVVKGHPAHPGTSELVGKAIIKAAQASNMPNGVFSLLQGSGHELGKLLVQHPAIKAVGFTGSFKGGKALYDIAQQREEPIPVYAEMGSTNPVFILPDALKTQQKALSQGLAASVTLGVGQFCTNPGLVLVQSGEETPAFIQETAEALANTSLGAMLSEGISTAYQNGTQALANVQGVQQRPETLSSWAKLYQTTTQTLLEKELVSEEVFGPSSVIVEAQGKTELLEAARKLKGHLTATVHATEADLANFAALFPILEQKVGRVILNGFPTGVEVCPSMTHGGPFPATTDSRSTSVGTLAIMRFVRPVSYQGFPQELLPAALQEGNPLGIQRLVDGQWES